MLSARQGTARHSTGIPRTHHSSRATTPQGPPPSFLVFRPGNHSQKIAILERAATGRRASGPRSQSPSQAENPEELATEQAERIVKTLTSVVDIASNIVELRDPYTSGH